jgi:hypothetical protein
MGKGTEIKLTARDMERMTMTVTVKPSLMLKMRYRVGLAIIRFGVRVIGMNVEVKEIES